MDVDSFNFFVEVGVIELILFFWFIEDVSDIRKYLHRSFHLLSDLSHLIVHLDILLRFK